MDNKEKNKYIYVQTSPGVFEIQEVTVIRYEGFYAECCTLSEDKILFINLKNLFNTVDELEKYICQEY